MAFRSEVTSILLSDVLTATEKLGLTNITPTVLNDAGNLIVHLAPYPIVARVAKRCAGDDLVYWREIKVAKHLMGCGVPVVPYTNLVPPGPHKVGDTWMTLWEYAEPFHREKLNVEQAIDMVKDLVKAMSDFGQPLPPLGVWRNVKQAGDYLRSVANDHRIAKLLSAYEPVNERIHGEALYPAYGDAHQGNLLASRLGWRWIDFEDVSLMPKFWDLASFIGNTALLRGLNHPVVQSVLKQAGLTDPPSFQFALQARVIMATMTNLALALDGHGDLEFAQAQLECIDDFLVTLQQELR